MACRFDVYRFFFLSDFFYVDKCFSLCLSLSSLYGFLTANENAKGHMQLEMIAIDTNLWPA